MENPRKISVDIRIFLQCRYMSQLAIAHIYMCLLNAIRQCRLITRNLISHIDMHTHARSTLYNPATLTFDLLNSGSMHADCRGPAVEYACTKFGDGSWSRFSFRSQTHTDRDRQTKSQTPVNLVFRRELITIGRVSYIRISLCYFCFRWNTVSLVQPSMHNVSYISLR